LDEDTRLGEKDLLEREGDLVIFGMNFLGFDEELLR
jgi:hypothetical protein